MHPCVLPSQQPRDALHAVRGGGRSRCEVAALWQHGVCVCVCVCVRARARVRVRALLLQ